MRIGILGTRGIPNRFGGFEQWAQHLSQGLVERGCEVYVYNSHNHPYKEKTWDGVHIVHCYDPEHKTGIAGQFIYDLNCIIDSRKRNFDIILQLGYTSSSVWGWLLPRKKSVVITNMDGFEWKRSKYNSKVKKFLMIAEKLAVLFSDHLIADSLPIKAYYDDKYNKATTYIPYGAYVFTNPDSEKISEFGVSANKYHLLIARMEPENNIETVIQGVINAESSLPLLIVGNYTIPHGLYLFNKYHNEEKIMFLGSIFDQEKLNNLRYYSNLYFHGHSVGGTNPSLLEAMACSAVICAHDNPFNKSILLDKALFFNSYTDISALLNKGASKASCIGFIKANINRIHHNFLVNDIIQSYFELLTSKGKGKIIDIKNTAADRLGFNSYHKQKTGGK